MLEPQKPMLLDAAKAFEAVINPGQGSTDSSITWSNVAALEAYIQRLQAAATDLTTKNRRLRVAHDTLVEKCSHLFNLDIVRHRDQWKDGLREMRALMDKLRSQGFGNDNVWRDHWDKQIYKALSFQYALGLESLNEGLPGMDVKLVFKHRKLQFDPPFEEIRSQYYKEVKRFLSIPDTFRGVGADSSVFQGMTRASARGVAVVFKKAERLFVKLQRSIGPFNDWIALGTVDLDELLAAQLNSVSDWELNYKVLKQRAKELERLPDEMRVECFTIATAPIKATIEEQMKKLSDGLSNALRSSGNKDLVTLTEFLTEALAKLDSRPQSLEEIRAQQAEGVALYESRPRMAEHLRQAEEKSRLLRGVGAATLELTAAQRLMEDFEARLAQHESMIAQQKEQLKLDVDKRIGTFNETVEKFAGRWKQFKPSGVPTDAKEAEAAAEKMKDWEVEFAELDAGGASLAEDCVHFGLPAPSFPALAALRDDMATTSSAWALYNEFAAALGELTKEDWVDFRAHTYLLDDLIKAWGEKLRGRAREPMALHLIGQLDKFQELSPSLAFVRGDAFTPNHWADLFRMLNIPPGEVTPETLSLKHFLDRADRMLTAADELKDLHARARGEVVIRDAIEELVVWGAETVFTLTEHASGVMLIKEWKDLMTAVGDNQSLLLSLKESPYYKNFVDDASVWETRLVILDQVLHLLNPIQRKWVYLEPIFSRGALPHEQQRFRRIDSDFKGIMSQIGSDNRVVSITKIGTLVGALETMLDQLERCQKALSEFLEEKRSKFPRFYFIGDDDLLEILGQASNPQVIQTHLKKLFAGIHKVEFGEKDVDGNEQILNMCSIAGEVVPMTAAVTVTDSVEDWLDILSKQMQTTLTACLERGLGVLDIHKLPSQVLCLAENVYFCQNVDAALANKSGLGQVKSELLTSLNNYTTMEVGENAVLGLKAKAVVLDVIHNLDVIDQLEKAGTADTPDWQWQKQLRFYMENVGSGRICRARMSDASFDYTYEYQGNAAKLVHSPLTDKCYLTLTQGMHLGYGGNPYGPAGTGKTESVKALAQALGRQCLVFNCDEGIDYKSMGRIFTGLVKCGAWGCFDEFNRLDEAVLSAISQQIQTIQTALKNKSPSLELLGMQMEVNSNAGIFVTLNPAGKGYGGRSQLPDNLKQLFRAVAMTAPDKELIAEVILYSESYKTAKVLGRKIVALFTLSSQLLSPQQHYDWGLRALKPILTAGGAFLASERKKSDTIDEAVEERLLLQAIRANMLSKLTFEDADRFEGLITDIFTNPEKEAVDYGELVEAIDAVMAEMGLQKMEKQVGKILQLHEQCNQRMGVIIVGPSGTGKSTLWNVLKRTYARLKKPLSVHVCNPKSMPREQLLGNMDLDTREWTDGVMTANARKAVSEPTEHQTWILCDGDIDPEWIESLNSVLDDNRLLTMPSGERIQFGPNVNFIFETDSLRFASPATVSRNGMILLSDEDFDPSVKVKSWLAAQPADVAGPLGDWMDELFYKALDWVTALPDADHMVVTTRIGLVMNGLSQLAGCVARGDFIVRLIAGLGGGIEPGKRADFAAWVFQEAGERVPGGGAPELACFVDGALNGPAYDPSAEVDSLEYGTEPPVLLTPHVQRAAATLGGWVNSGEPLLLVGPEGAGKSMILRHLFAQIPSCAVAVVNCSALTNASHVIQKLAQSCTLQSSSTGRVLRPKVSTAQLKR